MRAAAKPAKRNKGHLLSGPKSFFFTGGAEGIRTPGLVNASHALCQLSYSPLSISNQMVRDQL